MLPENPSPADAAASPVESALLRLALRVSGARAAALVTVQADSVEVHTSLGDFPHGSGVFGALCRQAAASGSLMCVDRAAGCVAALPVTPHEVLGLVMPTRPDEALKALLLDLAVVAAPHGVAPEVTRWTGIDAAIRASGQLILLWAGGRARELTGRWGALTGQPDDAWNSGAWRQAIHPDDRAALVDVLRQGMYHGIGSVVQVRLASARNGYRWYHGYSLPVPSSDPGARFDHVLTLVDAHEEHAQRERLRASEERLRLAVEASRIGMWESDLVTGKLFMSRRALALLGTTPDTFDEDAWQRLAYVHAEDRPRVQEAARVLHQHGLFELDIEHRLRPDAEGVVRWVRSISRVFHGTDGTHSRLVGTLFDITAEKEREEALRVARDRAEEMLRLRNTFLSNLSHEIRTPLTAVLGFAFVLRSETPPELHAYLDYIESSARRLSETLTSLLALSELHAGLRLVQVREVDLGALVASTAEPFRTRADGAGLRFAVRTPEGISMYTDPDAVRLVLENFLSNAIKFTRAGGVEVRVMRTAEAIRLSVSDTGQGIEPWFLEKLFDEFSQESSGLTRSHEGAGLGLAVAKQLATRIGCRIEVESEPSVGSTFTLVMPR